MNDIVCFLRMPAALPSSLSKDETKRAEFVEWQIEMIVKRINAVLFLIGMLMYFAANNQLSAQYTLPVEAWMGITLAANFISISETAWIIGLRHHHAELVKKGPYADKPFFTVFVMLLLLQSLFYMQLSTQITFVYVYSAQDSQFLNLLNQGFSVSGPTSFIEQRLAIYLITVIYTNITPSMVPLIFYFLYVSTLNYSIEKILNPMTMMMQQERKKLKRGIFKSPSKS